jgi:hypothetical protein
VRLEQFGLPASCRPDHAGHLHADEADLFPRKLNESTTKVEDPAVLKQPLTDPKVKKITLHFPLGLEVVARNMKGVTIKDALDAIHKQMKKRVRVPSSCDSFLVSSSSHFASS